MRKIRTFVPLQCDYKFPGCKEKIGHNEYYYENVVPNKHAFDLPIGAALSTTTKIACVNCAQILKPQKQRRKTYERS